MSDRLTELNSQWDTELGKLRRQCKELRDGVDTMRETNKFLRGLIDAIKNKGE